MVDWTPEQLSIIDSVTDGQEGIYVVDAAAGSGKTTTAVEMVKRYIQANPHNKVLMLVRGRDLKNKLKKEFEHTNNVECATVHSYAYQRITKQKGVKRLTVLHDRGSFFQTIGNIKKQDEAIKYTSANLIANLFDSYYSRDDIASIDRYALYLLADKDRFKKEAKSVKVNEQLVEAFQYIYKTMERTLNYTHNMYIKEYALNYTDISSFDLVVIDEAQDLNKYMSMLLGRIECSKMYLIGDEHQQLFSWDNCINIMSTYRPKATKVFNLTKSFRCNQEVLNQSNHVLGYLETDDYKIIPVVAGHNTSTLPEHYTKATLFYTNSAMIRNALNTIQRTPSIKIQFKGFDNTSVKSVFGNRFTYILSFLELDGYTMLKKKLEDKYKAWNNSIPYILHDLYTTAMKEYDSITDYMKEHGNEIEPEIRQSYTLYNTMKDSKIGIEGCLELLDKNLKKKIDKNTIIEEYSTVHKAKGFEWDYVVLGEDSWDFDTINGFCVSYVGLTRAKVKCDASALTSTINRYDEVKKYLQWTPTLDGYAGCLEADLQDAKRRRVVEESIPSLYMGADDETIFVLYNMLLDKKLPSESEFDYSDTDSVSALTKNYLDEMEYERNKTKKSLEAAGEAVLEWC